MNSETTLIVRRDVPNICGGRFNRSGVLRSLFRQGTLLLCSFALAAAAAAADPKGGLDETGPYEVVPGWFKPGIDRWNQGVVAVAVDTPDRIFIGNADEKFTRPNGWMLSADGKQLKEKSQASLKPAAEKLHGNMIMVLDRTGKRVENWTQWDTRIDMPHSIYINPYDPQRHIWIVNRTGQEILKFTNDGKELVMHIGERGVQGNDNGHFAEPAGLVFQPDGSFYVADGYVNSRIIKFDKDGHPLQSWGTKGSGPGQFDLVHALAFDRKGRLYASDRRNNRIQIFDTKGQFLEEWPNIASVTHLIAAEDGMWMASAVNYNRIEKFDLNGKLVTYWGVSGSDPGYMENPHQFDVDREGNFYIADAGNVRVQKFIPRANADKHRLMVPREFRKN